MLTLTGAVTQRIIEKLVKGQDYRMEIIDLINAEFLQYVIEFFKRIVKAKLENRPVTIDWYKAEFLNPDLSSDELIIHSGLNKKTISNMYNSARRKVVLEATTEHYDRLYELINTLVDQNEESVDVTLTIKFRGVSVDLNVNESLIVINVLAVKRAELRGGAWSTAGKQVEKVLMQVLCELYNVPSQNYGFGGLTDSKRETDFYLISQSGRRQVRRETGDRPQGRPVQRAGRLFWRCEPVMVTSWQGKAPATGQRPGARPNRCRRFGERSIAQEPPDCKERRFLYATIHSYAKP